MAHTTTSSIASSKNYSHLFETPLAQHDTRELETIITEIFERARTIHLEARRGHVASRADAQDYHNTLSNRKTSQMTSRKALCFEAAAAALSATSALFGGSNAAGLPGIMAAFSQGVSGIAGHTNKVNEAQVTSHDHAYQRQGTIVSEHFQRMKEADEAHQKSLEALERIAQQSQQTARTLLSGH